MVGVVQVLTGSGRMFGGRSSTGTYGGWVLVLVVGVGIVLLPCLKQKGKKNRAVVLVLTGSGRMFGGGSSTGTYG